MCGSDSSLDGWSLYGCEDVAKDDVSFLYMQHLTSGYVKTGRLVPGQ